MYKIHQLRKQFAEWWGSSLILGTVLIPITFLFSPYLQDDGVQLLCLPIGMSIALLMMFDVAALPGIFIGLMIHYNFSLNPDSALVISTWYVFSLTICWFVYRANMERRWLGAKMVLFNRYYTLWMIVLLPIFLLIGKQLLVDFELLPATLGMYPGKTFSLITLLNYEGLLLGCLVATQPFYYGLRVLLRPRFSHILKFRIRQEMAPNVSIYEIVFWIGLLAMVVFLLSHDYSESNILLSDHPLSLLLPVIIYGAMRFGLIVIGSLWSVALWIMLTHHLGLVPHSNQLQNLTFSLSLFIVFSVTIVLSATNSTRQRIMNNKARRLALIDPLTGLPNLRWLNRDLASYKESTLCFIRINNIDLLSRAYGIQLHIRLKQKIEEILKPVLSENEQLYQLPGYDLVLRLESASAEKIIRDVDKILWRFRLVWNGMLVYPHYGLGYCEVTSPVKHLNSLLGELSSVAEESLNYGVPQSADLHHEQLQSHIYRKVSILQQVQHALDNDGFVVMVQPIMGFRGECYYKVLLRLPYAREGLLVSSAFLPIVNEFGLSYKVDFWALEQALHYIDKHRARLPSLRVAVNFSVESVCRPSLLKDIKKLLEKYSIEPYQLILEIIESQLLCKRAQAMLTLAQLRNLGCRIAIDGIGTGYIGYDQLKSFNADILKIDGSYIGHLESNRLDQHIIESMCQIARLKKMIVVVDNVDTEKQQELLKKLGVDYLMGDFIGKPFLLHEL